MEKMKKKALLTDMDDTLFKSKKAYRVHGVKAAYDVLAKKNTAPDFTVFKNTYELARKAIKRELVGTAAVHNRGIVHQRTLEMLNLEFNAALLEQMADSFYNEIYSFIELYEGVKDTLLELQKRKITIVGVSDTGTLVQMKKMKQLHISKFFDAVVTSEEAGHEKPHPAIFLLALHKANITADQAVYVGDDPIRDIEGANAIGMTSIQATMRGDKEVVKKGLQKPDYIIKKYSDILDNI